MNGAIGRSELRAGRLPLLPAYLGQGFTTIRRCPVSRIAMLS
jgi:hypothetical protein